VNHFKKVALLAFALVLMSFTVSYAQDADSYTFKVHNKGSHTVTKLLVSENGKNYGYFNIGDGIDPGQTVTLVWDKSTNGESCHQYFKAVFDDGGESPAVKFDFCEENLVLEVQ
jgi:hypothetical protein